MKIKLTLTALLCIILTKVSIAQYFTSFLIEPNYLSGNNVLINSNPTNIVFSFELFRGASGGNGFQITATVQLVHQENGVETVLSNPVNISHLDFGDSGSWFYSQRVHAAIPSNLTTGTIKLKYSGYYYDTWFQNTFPLNGYCNTTYGLTLGGTPIPPPVLYPAFDAIPSQYANSNLKFTVYNPDNNTSQLFTKISPSNTQPVLTVGQSLYSPNSNYRLTLQIDGNLVLYRKNTNGTETGIWSTRTQGKASASLYFQTDGNLVIYSGSSTPVNSSPAIWASMIYNYNGFGTVNNAYYALQNDGNLVLYWPSYYYTVSKQPAWVIPAATDTQGGVLSAHGGNLTTPVYNPYALGSSFQPTR